MQKKYEVVIGAVVVVLIVVGAAIAFNARNKTAKQPDKSADTIKAGDKTIQKSDKDQAVVEDVKQAASAFPAGLPVEAGADKTTSYVYVPANTLDGQSVISYVSKKTVEENKVVFSEFLVKNGYGFMNKIETPAMVNYLATKGASQLGVVIMLQGKDVTVRLTSNGK